MSNGSLWVASGPGIPCGARLLSGPGLEPYADGRVWLDVCIIGQHLPQVYRPDEIHQLTAEKCPQLGLCPDCFGFGDVSNVTVNSLFDASRGIDQIRRACINCAGSGRPAIRITVKRTPTETTATIRPIPHEYVPPLDGTLTELSALSGMTPETCLSCGMAPDGVGPRGEKLHPDYE